MNNKNIEIIGGSKPNIPYNYKILMLSEKLKGNKVVFINNEGEEYQSICNVLGIEYTVEKITN